MATKDLADMDDISLAAAASLIGRARDQIERYVREWEVVTPHGQPGKGGRYTLDLDDVVVLEATARLDELHVPKAVAAGVMREVRDCVRHDPHWRAWVVYTGDDNIVIVNSDHDVQRAAERGAAVRLINPDTAREQLAHRLEHLPAQRKRGRPRYDSKWVQRALRESAKLGPERVSTEEASQLRPPMDWPWKKNE